MSALVVPGRLQALPGAQLRQPTKLRCAVPRIDVAGRCRRRVNRCTPRAAANEGSAPTLVPNNGQQYIEDTGFSVSKVSFGAVLAPVGVSLMVYGFGAFFQLLPGTDASPIMLVYGFPMSLLGFALNYAQLKPVPCFSTADALALRDTQCTDIQKQLREDVTRYRYGDEQHLDEALNRIFRFNTPKGIPRRLTPKLQAIREEVRDGGYTLVLSFATSPDMTLEMWETRLDKIQSFFGPGITATLDKVDQGVDVALTADGSGAGRGGGQQQEVLPPLMPGLAPRVVNKQ